MNLPNFLTRDPDGEIHLTGHRIGLYTVVRRHLEGRDENWIAEEYPSLPIELVRQVLAFYRANREEVEQSVAAYRAELQRQEREYVPSPGIVKMRRQLEELQRADSERASDPTWQSLPIGEKLRQLGIIDFQPKR